MKFYKCLNCGYFINEYQLKENAKCRYCGHKSEFEELDTEMAILQSYPSGLVNDNFDELLNDYTPAEIPGIYEDKVHTDLPGTKRSVSKRLRIQQPLTIEEATEILQKDIGPIDPEIDCIYEGLHILSKYTHSVIQAANHDIIYSEGLQPLLDAGIKREELYRLRELNWMVDMYSLAHFV